MAEISVQQLPAGNADLEAVQRYAAQLREHHAWAIVRWGARRYAEADLIPRGIITTRQELDAFVEAAS